MTAVTFQPLSQVSLSNILLYEDPLYSATKAMLFTDICQAPMEQTHKKMCMQPVKAKYEPSDTLH